MKKLVACFLSFLTALVPSLALAEEGIRVDGGAFVDSLQYMLKGMVGIFLVTGLIILAVVLLEKLTKKKSEEERSNSAGG